MEYEAMTTMSGTDISKCVVDPVIIEVRDPALLSVDNDPVNKPSHYTDGNIEVIDYILDKNFGFCLGNVVKYVSRAGKKDPSKKIEDLKKAQWYLNREIQRLEEDNNG